MFSLCNYSKRGPRRGNEGVHFAFAGSKCKEIPFITKPVNLVSTCKIFSHFPFRTDSDGFFTIGRGYSSFTPNKVINHNFIQNGPDAVVLYRKPVSSFPRASVATADGMVDVLIYGTNDDTKTTLIDKLAPGQIQINEQQLHIDGDESLSRCLSNDTSNLSAFVTSFPSPGEQLFL